MFLSFVIFFLNKKKTKSVLKWVLLSENEMIRASSRARDEVLFEPECYCVLDLFFNSHAKASHFLDTNEFDSQSGDHEMGVTFCCWNNQNYQIRILMFECSKFVVWNSKFIVQSSQSAKFQSQSFRKFFEIIWYFCGFYWLKTWILFSLHAVKFDFTVVDHCNVPEQPD